MSTPSINEIIQLSVSERIQLAEDIWDSIAANPEAVAVTDNQRQELDKRLEDYKKNPEAGSSWDEVRKRITNSL